MTLLNILMSVFLFSVVLLCVAEYQKIVLDKNIQRDLRNHGAHYGIIQDNDTYIYYNITPLGGINITDSVDIETYFNNIHLTDNFMKDRFKLKWITPHNKEKYEKALYKQEQMEKQKREVKQ